MNSFFRKLRWLTRRSGKETELREELQFHLEEEAEQRQENGLAVDEARWAARRELGNLAAIQENTRAAWGWTRVEEVARDVHYGLRQVRRNPGFSAIAIATLALCIGANTAIFSVVNSVILRPLAVPEPERVVTMWNAYPRATGTNAIGRNSPPDFFDRRELTDVFESVAAYDSEAQYNVGGPAEGHRVEGVQATPSLFHLLRARALLGRTFTEAEGEPGRDQVVLLSYGLWHELFGGDPAAIGRELRLDGRPYTVVGVMPPDFASFPLRSQEPRLWTPLAFTPEQRQLYHFNTRWNMLARLQPG
ncbi:MAG: ABC transporter permease, partial [Bryobacteraceae bacterium]